MSSGFQTVFDGVREFLLTKGIAPKISSAPPASREEIERFTHETGIQLPPSFAEFFTTFSNGYYFGWLAPGDEGQCGQFSLPDLDTLGDMHRDWIASVEEFASDPHSMDECVEPEFRENAFEIWQRMKGWLPFASVDEGDHFCVDLSTGAVVFDKHDWFDGFGEIAETNGMIAGSSLHDFIRTWGRCCFIPQFFADDPHPAGQTHLEWVEVGSEFEREH
jgi:cell wall assembly regulator SMI1